MHIAYEYKKFRKESLSIIAIANSIIDEYQSKGYSLTLRQLYYQFIARDAFPSSWIDPLTKSKNSQKNYTKLGNIINDARLSGMIDWESIEDRTRNLKKLSSWDSPKQIMEAVITQYRVDFWKDQPYFPEVWIEKDALIGVIENICNKWRVPFYACRGYNSQSEQWRAGKRFSEAITNRTQVPVVFHLGDHDPSGLDMTRDNNDRLNLFSDGIVVVKRLALNYDQIEKFNPPPNPAKFEDTRFRSYVDNYGFSCWELDALEPQVIENIIEEAVTSIIDYSVWNKSIKREVKEIEVLKKAMNRMPM